MNPTTGMTADSINYFGNVVSLIPKLWLRSGLGAWGNWFPPRSEQISLSHSKGSDGKIDIFFIFREIRRGTSAARIIIINVLRRKQRALAENYAAASIALRTKPKTNLSMKHFAIVFMQCKVWSSPVISQRQGPVVVCGGESTRRGKIFCVCAAPRRPIMQKISFVNSTPNVGAQLRPSSAVWNVSAFSYWIRFQLPSIWARFALIHCMEQLSDEAQTWLISWDLALITPFHKTLHCYLIVSESTFHSVRWAY